MLISFSCRRRIPRPSKASQSSPVFYESIVQFPIQSQAARIVIVWESGPESRSSGHNVLRRKSLLCSKNRPRVGNWRVVRSGGGTLLCLNSAQLSGQRPILFSDAVSPGWPQLPVLVELSQLHWRGVHSSGQQESLRSSVRPRNATSCQPLIRSSCALGCPGLIILFLDHCGLLVPKDFFLSLCQKSLPTRFAMVGLGLRLRVYSILSLEAKGWVCELGSENNWPVFSDSPLTKKKWISFHYEWRQKGAVQWETSVTLSPEVTHYLTSHGNCGTNATKANQVSMLQWPTEPPLFYLVY